MDRQIEVGVAVALVAMSSGDDAPVKPPPPEDPRPKPGEPLEVRRIAAGADGSISSRSRTE